MNTITRYSPFGWDVLFIKRTNLLIISLMMINNLFHAQTPDTVSLKEVNITGKRIYTSGIGKKFERIDTLGLLLFNNHNVADLLNFQTPVFIKNYGPGSLSTTSFRGGNAAQTAILWNGLNIQNSMLGQIDLSTIPTSLFNQIEIEYGGSSANWGSGAMGGSIHLNNEHQLNKGLYSKLNLMASNIGSNSLSTDIGFSDKKLSFKLKAYSTDSENKFKYFSADSNKVLVQKNAAFKTVSVLPEFKFYLTPYQQLSVAVWLNKGTRQLPTTLDQEKFAYQYDKSDRLNVNWNIEKKIIASNVKLAYLADQLDYTDSTSKIFSNSKTKNMIVENDNFINWKEGQVLNIAANLTANKAITNNYNGVKELSRASITVGNKGYYINGKLEVRTSLRAEQVSTGEQPVTYNFALNYKLNDLLEMKLNSGKVYRLPTLNDLYWYPGGNINLKPEEGFTTDGTLNFNSSYKKYTFQISGCVFNKRISNWILWLPGANGNPSPSNVKEVWSRGTETSWIISYRNKNWLAQIKCFSSYILSTVTKSDLENDNTTNKQLVYTPRYVINGIATIGFKKLILSYQHNYTGYRFTTSDNSRWVAPYNYSTLRMNYLFELRHLEVGTFVNINNALNTSFEIIENKPMPLRYLEIGLQINYRKKQK